MAIGPLRMLLYRPTELGLTARARSIDRRISSTSINVVKSIAFSYLRGTDFARKKLFPTLVLTTSSTNQRLIQSWPLPRSLHSVWLVNASNTKLYTLYVHTCMLLLES
jgi:hypothetical protein